MIEDTALVTVTITNRLEVGPLDRLPSPVLRQIVGRLTFDNPQFLENEKRGFSNWGVPPQIQGYQIDGDLLIIPRGFGRQLVEILHRAGVQYRIQDRRRTLAPVDFTFRGELRDFQAAAVEAMSCRDFGTLAAPTGSGKTVMALALVALRKQQALIVVHTRELLEQWISRIQTFLGIPAQEVGVIGGGKMQMGQKITVGLVQGLYKCAREIAPYIGHLVVDECHRAPSRTFTEAVTAFDCRYMLGLSATPWRRDGLSRLINVNFSGPSVSGPRGLKPLGLGVDYLQPIYKGRHLA